MTQVAAIEAINSGKNVCVTGGAGAGKSWVIKQIQDENTVLLAPTGIAALNIGGMTCHSALGLPLGMPTHADTLTFSQKSEEIFSNKSPVKRIIIDEVFMVRADMFDLINIRLQRIRANSKPFGGLQMVVVGDPYQLEPVLTSQEEKHFYSKYKTPFAFGAKCWNFDTIVLSKIYRQKDVQQAQVLNDIRLGVNLKEAKSFLRKNTTKYAESSDVVTLTALKVDAKRINDTCYAEIKGKESKYTGTMFGFRENELPVPKLLKLKLGCKVLIKANSAEGGYVNGNRGVVKQLGDESILVELDTGALVSVEKYKWEKYGYESEGGLLDKVVVGSFEQFPLTLGYAITMHSSQGMTLDAVCIDVGAAKLGHGQMYMAISRVRDLRNLGLKKTIQSRHLVLREEVNEFYEKYKS